ncbi:MAG: four helix bundle protein [Verrucomicrobiota bacterium]
MDTDNAPLGHEKLAVYQDAIAFVGWTEELFEAVSKGASLKKDLEKGSNRIPVLIAEGNGKPFGRARTNAWQSALSLAMECAASLDVLVGRGVAKKKDVAEGKSLLGKIAEKLEGLLEEQTGFESKEELGLEFG